MDFTAILNTITSAAATPVGSVVTWYLFSTAAGSLPLPMANERWYGAFFNFVQALAANHGLIAQKSPVLPKLDNSAPKATAEKPVG